MRLVLELPLPPSMNHYWRWGGRRMLISRAGREYRELVIQMLAGRRSPALTGRLDVAIAVHPPSRRAIDLDNRLKSLLDALEHAQVYRNDSQIDRLEVVRAGIVPGGQVVVEIKEFDGTASVPA